MTPTRQARAAWRSLAAMCTLAIIAAGCATAADDSWSGEAGNQLQESDGGFGGTGGAGASGGTTSHTSHTVGPTSGPTSTVTTTTGGGTCDEGSCDSCQQCAMNGVCAADIDACFNNVECSALLDCLGPCIDETCANTCFSAHPSGAPLYEAVGTCVFCNVCRTSCGAC